MSSQNYLTIIQEDIYGTQEQFASVLSDRSINFEREAGFALQVLVGSEYALKIASSNRQSVINAVVNIAAIGISLNPAKKQAYLVPRDGKICLDISYMGLMDLAQATGSVLWAQASLVHEEDSFALNGYDKPPEHKFNPFSKSRGSIVGVYCVVKTATGDYLTHTMTIEDVYAIRDRSQSWKSGKSSPWKTDEGEMIKKTCVKQAYKYWPKTDRLETAIHHLNTEGGEGIAFANDANQQKAPVIPASSALKESMSGLTLDRKQVIEAVSLAAIGKFEADDVVGAFEEYSGIDDSEEKMALWSLLPSKVRAAIKKHGETLKEAA